MADIPGEEELRKVKGKIVDLGNAIDRSSGKWKSFGESVHDAVKQIKDYANEAERLGENDKRTASEQRRFEELAVQLQKTGGAAKVLASVIKEKLVDAFDRLGKKILAVGTSLANWGIDKLTASIKRVYEYQEKWTRAIGEFRTRIGAAGSGMAAASRMAKKWEGTMHALTGQFGQGITQFGDFAEGMGRKLEDADDALTDFGLRVGRTFGLTTEEAAGMTRSMENMGATLDDQKALWGNMADQADKAGLNLGQFSRELIQGRDFMLRFGKAGQKTFIESAAYVRKLGISLKSLEGFYDMTDTFEGATQAASKLNTVFGTTISSMGLMLEQDPGKRFEQVRQALVRQGKDIKNMMPAEIKLISETTGLTVDETNAMKSGDTTLEQHNRKKSKQIDVEKRVKDAMNKTALTMFSFSQAFDKITVAIANAIKPFLQLIGLAGDGNKKFDSFSSVMGAITKRIVGFFNSLAGQNDWMAFMEKAAAKTKEYALMVADFFSPKKIDSTIGTLVDVFKQVWTWSKRILVVWAGFKAFQAFGSIAKSWKDITSSLKQANGASFGVQQAGSDDAFMTGAMTQSVMQPGPKQGMLSGAWGKAKGASKALGGGKMGGIAGGIGGAVAGLAGVMSGEMKISEGVGTAIGSALGGLIGGPVGAAVLGWLGKEGGGLVEKLWNRWKNPAKAAADDKIEETKRKIEEEKAKKAEFESAAKDPTKMVQLQSRDKLATMEKEYSEKQKNLMLMQNSVGLGGKNGVSVKQYKEAQESLENFGRALSDEKNRQKKLETEVAQAAQKHIEADLALAQSETRRAQIMSLSETEAYKTAQTALTKELGGPASEEQIIRRVAAMPVGRTAETARGLFPTGQTNYANRPSTSTPQSQSRTGDVFLDGKLVGQIVEPHVSRSQVRAVNR